MYLAYARHDLAIPRDAVLDSARALLDAGADPDAGRLWHGLPSPFTVLTGVLGEGELGPDRQPRHPHWRPLAELLLDRGANPNDGQGLYNRMFTADDEHLELLLAHGLGRGDGGPWRALLGDAVDSPAQLVAGQLDWAVTHDLPERARLLLGHGARPTAELAEKAARFGHRRVAGVLREAGAPEPRLGSVDAFLGAVLAGQEVAVSPGTIAQARAERPGILVWAAATGRSRAVATLLDLGFDVDARGRGDIPEESTWETALHHAAGNGDVALVRLLLARGADRRITDERFDATAAGWATHAGHLELATELLEA
jgi:ankyrin repeat protein